jgi:hypothetical protein
MAKPRLAEPNTGAAGGAETEVIEPLTSPTDTASAAVAAQPSTAKPAVAVAPKVPKIHPSRFHLNEHAHNTWAAHPERSVKFEDMLEPSFWAHISESKLRPGDTIEIYPADNTYRATLAVRASGKLFAQVAVLNKVEFPELVLDVTAKYTTMWADPQTKWAVVRIKDNAVMQGGFDAQDAAMRWLGVNAKSLAA